MATFVPAPVIALNREKDVHGIFSILHSGHEHRLQQVSGCEVGTRSFHLIRDPKELNLEGWQFREGRVLKPLVPLQVK